MIDYYYVCMKKSNVHEKKMRVRKSAFIARRDLNTTLSHCVFFKMALNSRCTIKCCSIQLSKVLSGEWDFSPSPEMRLRKILFYVCEEWSSKIKKDYPSEVRKIFSNLSLKYIFLSYNRTSLLLIFVSFKSFNYYLKK